MNELWDEVGFMYADKHQSFAGVQLYFTYYLLSLHLMVESKYSVHF